MTPLQIIQILNLINTGLKVADSAGVNISKFNEMATRARAEGREITQEELQELADDAQAAINKI